MEIQLDNLADLRLKYKKDNSLPDRKDTNYDDFKALSENLKEKFENDNHEPLYDVKNNESSDLEKQNNNSKEIPKTDEYIIINHPNNVERVTCIACLGIGAIMIIFFIILLGH